MHLQVITAVVNTLFIAIGLRDIFSPGTPLPMPDDDKLMMIFAVGNDKRGCGTESFRLVGARDFLSNIIGAFIVTVSAAKLTTVFSHSTEGTFLRRNLLITFGVADICIALLLSKHTDFIKTQFGVPFGMAPFMAMMFLEGAVYLYDALARPRKTKKTK